MQASEDLPGRAFVTTHVRADVGLCKELDGDQCLLVSGDSFYLHVSSSLVLNIRKGCVVKMDPPLIEIASLSTFWK